MSLNNFKRPGRIHHREFDWLARCLTCAWSEKSPNPHQNAQRHARENGHKVVTTWTRTEIADYSEGATS